MFRKLAMPGLIWIYSLNCEKDFEQAKGQSAWLSSSGSQETHKALGAPVSHSQMCEALLRAFDAGALEAGETLRSECGRRGGASFSKENAFVHNIT